MILYIQAGVRILPILEWLNKSEALKISSKIPYKILKLNEDMSYGDDSENMIIKGDNLETLKALLPYYKGRVKCIYIDPPYNTGSRIDADGEEVGYDDNLEHSIWCSMMYPRLELLKELLTEDGLIAVQIDDDEFCNLYMIMSEIFNRKNLKVISVKMSESTGVKMASINKVGSIPKLKEYIILASPNGIKNLNVERVPKEKWDEEYKYLVKGVTKEEIAELQDIMLAEDANDDAISRADAIAEKIELSSVNELFQEKNLSKNEKDIIKYENAWRIVRDVAVTGNVKLLADNKKKTIEKGCFIVKTPQGKNYLIKKDYNSETPQPRCKLLFADMYLTVHPGDFWQDIKTTGLENEGGVVFKKGKKPEALLKRIITMCTKEGDIVLDSFAGSGTTCAVAHKLKRKYIGIEQGNHIYTHVRQRLINVINGEQQGISKVVNWNGGGGFKFYDVSCSILDDNGNINNNIDFMQLASHIWFSETKIPFIKSTKEPLLGIHNDVAYYLIDDVLSQRTLEKLPQYAGKKIIYAKATRMNSENLERNNIIFKQLPYSIKAN